MSYRKLLPILLATLVVGVLAVPFIWAVLYFGAHLYGNYKVRGHQEFAVNGVSQIKPAREMDQLFADCRHFITYGPNDVPLFTSVAYFGNRYQLTMQVAVDIQSASSGATVGEPQFYLNEVTAVTVSPSGQVGASFSRNLNFGAAKWQQVYVSGGDFSTIGFNVAPTSVPDFRKYADASRPSN
ncbi:MAG: hypothetical protein WD229_04335 [Pirellulales bacterium]